jgi:hypothetical protein
MHCRDFESRLNDILDDRGQPRADAQLVAHADGCDPCRQLLDGQQVLFDGLKQRQFPTTRCRIRAARRGGSGPAMQVTRGASSRRIGWAIATVLSDRGRRAAHRFTRLAGPPRSRFRNLETRS